MTERLSDQIYRQLREQIIGGEIVGNTFLTESEVAAQYSVSKAPVKTALQQLSQQGYLTCFPRRGYMVTSISVQEYRHIRELRAHIEKLSVILAVQRATDEEILSLRETLKPSGSDRDPYKTSNTCFHARLAEISHNPYIYDTLYRFLGITSRYAFMQGIDDMLHEKIIDALERRDTETAIAYLEKDLHIDSPSTR